MGIIVFQNNSIIGNFVYKNIISDSEKGIHIVKSSLSINNSVLNLLSELSTSVLSLLSILFSYELIHNNFSFLYGIGEQRYFNNNLSLGNQKETYNICSINDSHIFKILNQYGIWLESVQYLLNEVKGVYEDRTSHYVQANKINLLLNDFFISNENILSSSQLGGGEAASLLTISEGLQDVQSVMNKLHLYDIIQSIQSVMSSSQLGGGEAASLLTISEGLQDVQSVMNKLLNTDILISNEYLHNSIALNQAVSSSQLTLSEGLYNNESIKNVLSDAEQSIQTFINDVSNLSDLFSTQTILNSLYTIPTKFSSIIYKIYLDGTDISSLINAEISIEKNQSNIHNSISFSSISQELFNKADPSYLEGEIRIEAHIENTVMYFLLEERSFSSDGSVAYWGRDATARDNSPWAASVSVFLSSWESAKELCESLTIHSALDWDILDWTLPDTYESVGTPIEIISEIVSELGAIIRANDDGSLLIRYPFPIRPVDVKISSSVYSYSSDNVYDINYSEEKKEAYNIITVTADTSDKVAPILEIEDAIGSSRIIGEDSYIRAFYYEDPTVAPSILTQDQTDGSITVLGKDNYEVTEIITFTDGSGSSSYPLKTLKTISWLGRSNSILTWDIYSTNITLETESSCLAEITYDSEYYRYKATGHNVEELLTIFEIQSTFASSVQVKTAPIDFDKEGNEITTSLLTSQAALAKRGEIWIDSNKYNEEIISFESPFLDNIKDGNIIWLETDRIPSGNYQVFDVSISISGPKVVNTMRVKKWQI